MAQPKLQTIGGIQVGNVPISDIKIVRKNFRRMNEAQRATLQQSIDQHGFKSFLLVAPHPEGGWELLDGHHRLEELVARGLDFAPILVMESGDQAAQLARLQFNVSAETDAQELYKFMAELQQDFETSVVAIAANVSSDFLRELGNITQARDEGPQLPPPGPSDLAPPSGKKKPELNGLVVVIRPSDGYTAIGRVNSLFTVPAPVHSLAEELGLAVVHHTEIPLIADLDALKAMLSAVVEVPEGGEDESEESEEGEEAAE